MGERQRGIVFTEVNDQWRSYRARYHRLGRPTEDDVTLYEETEELGFSVGVGKSQDKSTIFVSTGDIRQTKCGSSLQTTHPNR